MEHNGIRVPARVELTRRERQILEMTIEGLGAREIAQQLGISYRTVENHQMGIRNKFGLRRMIQVVRAVLTEVK